MAREGTKSASFTHEGRRYWAYGKTKEEAETNLKIKKALIKRGYKEYNDNTSVAEWARIWLEDYKRDTVGAAWFRQLKNTVENQIIPHIGSKSLKSVRPIDITRLYNAHANLSSSGGADLVQATRSIFDTAEANDLISKSPARHVKSPKFKEKIGHRAITKEERQLTLKAAEKTHNGLFFLVTLYCGLRPQEVAALQMKDFDREKEMLYVYKALKSDDTLGETKTKSGKREVPIPETLYEKLIAINKKPNEYMFVSPKGSLMKRTQRKRLWEKFKKAMEDEAGHPIAEDLTPYCYRHTYCTDLRDAGVPLTEAKYLMGHSSIKVTADIYTHHSEEASKSAISKLEKYHKSL